MPGAAYLLGQPSCWETPTGGHRKCALRLREQQCHKQVIQLITQVQTPVKLNGTHVVECGAMQVDWQLGNFSWWEEAEGDIPLMA